MTPSTPPAKRGSGPLQVVVIYCREDRSHVQMLRDHLHPLLEQGAIELWSDLEIVPGDYWGQEILRRLDAADIVVVLVRARTMGSFVRGELERALQRQRTGEARVIPVKVEEHDWQHPELAGIQGTPVHPSLGLLAIDDTGWASLGAAYAEVARGIGRAVESLRASRARRPDGRSAPREEPAAAVPPVYFRDFDLRLFRDGLRGCCVEVVGDAGHAGPELMGLDRADRRDEVNGLVRQVRAGSADAGTCARLGGLLFAAAFPQSVRRLWIQRQQLEEKDSYLRLRLLVQDPWLAGLPWELLHADLGTNRGNYLGLSSRRPIVRRLGGERAEAELPAFPAAGLRVLRVCAGGLRRAGAPEAAGIPGVHADELPAAGREALREHAGAGYHVLQLPGPAGETPYVVLRGADGQEQLLRGAQLAQLLPASVRLVVLRPPPGAAPAQVDALLHVAAEVVRAGVPAAVAVQSPVSDDVFAAFARALYARLAAGLPLEVCMAEGRRAVLALGGERPDWAMPALFSSVHDGMLWQHGQDAAAAEPFSLSVRPASVRHNLDTFHDRAPLGRDAEFADVIRALRSLEPPAVVNLYGPEGSGRSALARYVARRSVDWSQRHPADPLSVQAVVWVSMLDPSPTLPDAPGTLGRPGGGLDELFVTVARTLQMPRLLSARPEERMVELRHLLHEMRCLLVLDDADQVLDARRLHDLFGAPSFRSRILVISRTPYPDPTGERILPVELGGLPAAHARELFLRDAGEAQPGRELDAVIDHAQGLPLLLRWAAGHLRDGETLRSLGAFLERSAGSPTRVDDCLRVSLARLGGDEHVLLCLGLFPEPAHAELVGEAAGVGGARLRDALKRMVELRLARNAAGATEVPRYVARSRIRAYARSRAAADAAGGDPDRPGWSAEAARGAIRYLLKLLDDDEARLPTAVRPRDEVGNVLWAARQAYELRDWERVVKFRDALRDRLFEWGYWNQVLQVGEWAFEAADCLGDLRTRAWCTLYPLHRVYLHQGEYEHAWRWGERARALFGQMLAHEEEAARARAGERVAEPGGPAAAPSKRTAPRPPAAPAAARSVAVAEALHGLAVAERGLANVLMATGRHHEARPLFMAGLEHNGRLEQPDRHQRAFRGHLLAGLAHVAAAAGEVAEAQEFFEQALAIYQDPEVADDVGVATTCHSLGMLLLGAGRVDEAEARLGAGRDALTGHADWSEREAQLTYGLALVAEARGSLPQARRHLKDARDLLRPQLASNRFEAADLAAIDAVLERVSARLEGAEAREAP